MSAKRIARAIDTAKFKALYLLCGQQLDKKMRNNPKRWNENQFQSFTPQEELYEELTYELETLFNDTLSIDDLHYDHSLSILEKDTREEQERKKKQRQDDLGSFKDKLKSNENQQLGRSPENVSSKARSSKNNTSPGFDYVKTWKKAFAKAKETRTSFSDQFETEPHLLPFYNKLRNHRFDRFIWPAVQHRLGNPAMARQADYMDNARWKTIDREEDVRKELTKALAKNPLVLMHDDAGMGKTAFSWMLFEHLLKVNEAHPYVIRLEGIWPRSTDENRNPLPLMELVLEELLGKRLLGRQIQGSDPSKDSEDEFREAVRKKDVFILLDGFDQMTNDDRAAALEEIRKTLHFESVIPKCHWLVSGRPFSFLNNELSTELFRPQVLRLRLKKFDQTRQDKYFDDLSQNKFFLDQPKEKRKPLDFMCSSWKNEATESDLGVPLHLSEIRKLIEDFLPSPSNDSSNRALLEVYSSSDLHARVSQVYLQRAVIHSKDIVAPQIPKTDALKIDVLRQICACLAMQMMLDENYNGSIDNTTTRLETYRNIGRINIVDAYLERSRNRYEQSRTDKESYWDWGVEVLRTIEVTHRGDIDVFTHECRSFRDKKAMEWYAAFYLANYFTQSEWDEGLQESGKDRIREFLGNASWTLCWRMAMELPDLFYEESHIEDAIVNVLRKTSLGKQRSKHCEWMWIAWTNRLEQDDEAMQRKISPLQRANKVIEDFRQEFKMLIEAENSLALRLRFNASRDSPNPKLTNPNHTENGWYRRIPDVGDYSIFRGERPAKVTVSPFWLRKFVVTSNEYCLFDPMHRSFHPDGDLPATQVCWHSATMFCLWLGPGYRLPTEAEWETACRANQLENGELRKETKYWFGDDDHPQAYKHMWCSGNCDNRPHSLEESIEARRHQNRFGLLDMSGNVWELCSDYYGRLDFIPVVDPVGPTDGLEHVIRGGSWDESLAFCGSAGRNSLIPGKSEKNIGFRIAFSLSEPPKPSEDAHEFERSNDTDQ